jgi:ferrous iron transport protein A
MTTLKTVSPGDTVRVKVIGGGGAIKRRIMDMGITKGCEIYVRKVAPLGDPVEITVRGYELSLRRADAEIVEIELVGQASGDGDKAAETVAGA